MKKIVLFIVLVMFALCTTSAQVIEGTSNAGNTSNGISGDINFGVKAGIGASTFFGSGLTGASARPSFYVGGIAEIPVFFDGFYLQPELQFAIQGADFALENLNLLYVHLPVMAKYHITDEIAVEFGPQIGFLIADNWNDTFSGLETNKVNLGINIGGGYRLNENFYFQLRFSPGFTKIFDNTNLKNGAVQVGAAYFF